MLKLLCLLLVLLWRVGLLWILSIRPRLLRLLLLLLVPAPIAASITIHRRGLHKIVIRPGLRRVLRPPARGRLLRLLLLLLLRLLRLWWASWRVWLL